MRRKPSAYDGRAAHAGVDPGPAASRSLASIPGRPPKSGHSRQATVGVSPKPGQALRRWPFTRAHSAGGNIAGNGDDCGGERFLIPPVGIPP
jgi:hypothetical protein